MIEAPSPITVSHPDPPTAGRDRSADWEQGVSFKDFLPTAEKNVGLWTSIWDRAQVPEDLLVRAAAVPGSWHLLVLSADWCGDASNTVPMLARFAQAAPNLDLRLLDRDTHLDLMNEHLTGGTAQAIPAVILLGPDLAEWAWWGPRPAELQAWFKGEGQQFESDERYKRLRKWYARDHGRTMLDEVVTLLEHAAQP
jgi:hypothetical protein